MKALEKITAFNKKELPELLAPVWDSKDVLGETGVIVGKDGCVRLLGMPIAGSVVVKNTLQDVLYEEGVDYVLDGNQIKRVEGGSLPYFEMEDYFMKAPNHEVVLKADPAKTDVPFDEQRYVFFAEGAKVLNRYISVSYKTEKPFAKGLIEGDSALQAFVNGLKEKKQARIKFYGDSITVGCNASGTQYGGNVSPYLPDWITLVKTYLEEKYDATLTVENHAVGGWSSVNGIDSFEEKCSDGLDKTDLLCVGFGANDLFTEPEHFKKNLQGMMDKYFKANPNGSVLLYSTLLPNSQLIGWRVNQTLFEDVLFALKKENANVGVAKVSSVYLAMEASGKPTRDWLANSVNHPSDFGVRIYAQTILKTLLGDEYYGKGDAKMKKVTLLGDSIRQIGYGARVAELLGDEYEVFQPEDNCRFVKYTLRMLFDYREQIKGSDVIHWNNGLWDITSKIFDDGQPFTSEEEYVVNMLRVAKELKKLGKRIIFATTTPCHKEFPYNENSIIERYNELIVPKLQEMGVEINDLHASVNQDIYRYIGADQIHLSEEGVEMCAKQVVAAIKGE